MNFQAAALHAWVRWHDRIKILSAQVAMGKKSSVAASKGIAGVPAGPLARNYLKTPPHKHTLLFQYLNLTLPLNPTASLTNVQTN